MASAPAKKSNKTLVIVLVIVGLVVAVPCVIGVVAAIAIPAFVQYMRASKTAEARANLRSLYTAAAGYYAQEQWGGGGAVSTGCTVSSASTPNTPGPEPSMLGPLPPSFEAIGWSPNDPVRYQYEIVSVGGCGHPPDTPLYTFRAHGDLDGDGEQSLFELTAHSGASGEMVQDAEMRETNPTE